MFCRLIVMHIGPTSRENFWLTFRGKGKKAFELKMPPSHVCFCLKWWVSYHQSLCPDILIVNGVITAPTSPGCWEGKRNKDTKCLPQPGTAGQLPEKEAEMFHQLTEGTPVMRMRPYCVSTTPTGTFLTVSQAIFRILTDNYHSSHCIHKTTL